MSFNFVPIERRRKLLDLLIRAYRIILYTLTYFSQQNRYDRRTKKHAFKTLAEAKRAQQAYWKKKREEKRVQIQHGGTITTDKPFPARGSLLTEDERNDPLAK